VFIAIGIRPIAPKPTVDKAWGLRIIDA